MQQNVDNDKKKAYTTLMIRKEFVNKVFDLLEKRHINLYHDISKKEFERQKNMFLLGVENLSSLEFECGIIKLFALFKDAHTFYGQSFIFKQVEAHLENINGVLYLKHNGMFQKVIKVNGIDIKTAEVELKKYVSFEVEERATFCVRMHLKEPVMLKGCGLGISENVVTYSLENGEDVSFTKNTSEKHQLPIIAMPNYAFYKEDNNILVIKYLRCRENAEYPIAQFICEIDSCFSQKPTACLIDVRDNLGGNSNVIKPVLNWLKQNKIKTYILMGHKTFSSGCMLLADAKIMLGATLLGTSPGHPTSHYGNPEKLEIDGKCFFASKKYFDFAPKIKSPYNRKTHSKIEKLENACPKIIFYIDAFNYTGPIMPDIEIKENLEKLNQGLDGQREEALDIISKKALLSEREQERF